MPLKNGYGVLAGTLFIPQESTEQGNWFHGVYYMTAPGSNGLPFLCTTDFSSANANNIQYKIFNNLRADLFAPIAALPDGYNSLASTSTSGAIDYVRSPLLGPYGCIELVVALWNKLFGASLTDGWITSDGNNAVAALQQQLNTRPRRVYCFGEPFDNGTPTTENGVTTQKGMHNVHMNQGDPPPVGGAYNHQLDDGIWQDGCSIFENADGSLTAFCSKFVTQTFNTNDQGLPA